MSANRLQRQGGLTIVEMLVAVLLLVVGAAAISTLIAGGLVRGDANSAMTHAVDLATQEIEDIRSLDYATLASRAAPNSPETSTGTPFTIQTTVTRDSPASNMSTIVVLVSWAQRGRNYSYRLESIYADTRT